MSWAGHVLRAEGQIIRKITMWKPDKKDRVNDQDNG